MLTWAIAWMTVQMARADKEIYDQTGLIVLLFVSIIADAVVLGYGAWVIFG